MKNKKQLLLGLGLMITTLSLLIFACQKNVTPLSSSSSPRNVGIYLTDDPCQYDSVFIDIQYVEIKIDTSTQHMNDDHFGDNENDHNEDHMHHDQYGFWDTLSIRSGVYDVLQLRNGIDTLLGTTNIPAGKIRKIRLTLGSNNSVVISGISHPLNLFPNTNNYEYVKIHGEDEDNHFRPGQTSMWLDFNVCKSIRFDNGQYYLKPFLSVFAMDNTGRIQGIVLPNSAQPYVTVWNATDTASALPEHDGEYKIRGLNAGIYSLQFKGSFGYMDTTITNLEVKAGQLVKIPVITLHQ
ncbi:MAG: DUF4382 domain-containing protein [Bacteroidota bacterium]|jgi:hypothetical protein|nr:DUF4382 domain-containing protein [Bacteroidota bacterium]